MDQSNRTDKNHPNLPQKPKVIIATAYGREEVMQRSEKVGLDGFLLKPVGQSVPFDSIMIALGKEAQECQTVRRVSGRDAEDLRKIRSKGIVGRGQ